VRRLACVDLPALPLQLLLRRGEYGGEYRRGEYGKGEYGKDCPVAVVDCDKPQGKILWVNERARASRIVPGMRYAAALSLSGTSRGALRAGEVSPREIERAVEANLRLLKNFTPDVEAAPEDPGVFWLNASGLNPLYESLFGWAELIRDAFDQNESLRSTVVVGYSRFGTLAVAKAAARTHGNMAADITVFRDAAEERKAMRDVPLESLRFDPRRLETLRKLGVRTVGQFADLPPEGIEKRLGKNAGCLHRQARGDIEIPLNPSPSEQPICRRVQLEHAETEVERLVAVIENHLSSLLEDLAARHRALTGIQVAFHFEGGGRHLERVRPAAPTNDLEQVVELVQLRLAVTSLPDRVTELVLTVLETPITRLQLELFADKPRRDLAAANRALARLRAEFGEDAVVRARLGDGHLPEALFFWERLSKIENASPCGTDAGALVRRIYSRPIPLPPRPRQEPDGWILRGLEQGPVVRVLGPYVISGGWWRKSVHREYHFAETQKGELLWVYYDRPRRRWFIQGRVE